MYLQEICKKLHHAIDKIDEERYDTAAKVEKVDKEVRGSKHVVLLIKETTLQSWSVAPVIFVSK